VNEIHEAIRERHAIHSAQYYFTSSWGGQFYFPAAFTIGSDISSGTPSANSFTYRRRHTVALAEHLADPATFAAYASRIAFYDAAGMAGTGENRWRRLFDWDGTTPDPEDYTMVAYDAAPAPGEIIGPWVIEDIQRMLSVSNVMKSSVTPESQYPRFTASNRRRGYGPYLGPLTWTDNGTLFGLNGFCPHYSCAARYKTTYPAASWEIREYSTWTPKTTLTVAGIGPLTVEEMRACMVLGDYGGLPYQDYDGLGAEGSLYTKVLPLGVSTAFPSDTEALPSDIAVNVGASFDTYYLLMKIGFSHFGLAA
jgi:hypothetical protein